MLSPNYQNLVETAGEFKANGHIGLARAYQVGVLTQELRALADSILGGYARGTDAKRALGLIKAFGKVGL